MINVLKHINLRSVNRYLNDNLLEKSCSSGLPYVLKLYIFYLHSSLFPTVVFESVIAGSVYIISRSLLNFYLTLQTAHFDKLATCIKR